MNGRVSIAACATRADAEAEARRLVEHMVLYEDAYSVLMVPVLPDFLPPGETVADPIKGAGGQEFREQVRRHLLRRWESTTRTRLADEVAHAAIETLRGRLASAGLEPGIAGNLLGMTFVHHNRGGTEDQNYAAQKQRELDDSEPRPLRNRNPDLPTRPDRRDLPVGWAWRTGVRTEGN